MVSAPLHHPLKKIFFQKYLFHMIMGESRNKILKGGYGGKSGCRVRHKWKAAGKYRDLFRGWWVTFQAAMNMWWGARSRILKRLKDSLGSHHGEPWILGMGVWLLFFELWRTFKEFLRRAVAWGEVYFGRSPGGILLNVFERWEPRGRGVPRIYYSCLGKCRGIRKQEGKETKQANGAQSLIELRRMWERRH